jgi:DNA-binding PadR family transcriptional regulator
MADVRITVPVLRVLQAFLAAGGAATLYGLELMDQTGLKSGTLYPVLARLEEAGWATSSWEDADPRDAGRPRRRYYELTGLGQRAGAAALGEFSQLATPVAGARPRRHQSVRPVWGQA